MVCGSGVIARKIIHSFNKYLLSAYYVLRTLLNAGYFFKWVYLKTEMVTFFLGDEAGELERV